MSALKHADSSESSSSKGSTQEKGGHKDSQVQPEVNPLWHGVATHVQHNAVAGAADDAPEVQHACASCTREYQAAEREHRAVNSAKLCPSCREKTPAIQTARDVSSSASVASDDAIQFWNCGEYSNPTCSPDLKDMVQTKCASCDADDKVQHAAGGGAGSSSIHAEARMGLKGACQSLPHGAAIQAAFGRHDVSHVRTNVGGASASANKRMGSLAFTSGSRIGFRESPSLHLAAHEAAHVVQQRSGLSLPGKVGRAGDRWERHADQVADAVTAGKSAEPLLDKVAPTGRGAGSGAAVQQQITSGATRLMEPHTPPASAAGGAQDAGGNAAEVDPKPQSDEQKPAEPAEMSKPENACKAAGGEEKKKDDKKQKPRTEKPPEKAPAAVKKGVCYSEAKRNPPKGTEKPKKDAPRNKVKEESSVFFPKWKEPDEKCECEVGNELNKAAGKVPAQVAPASGQGGGAVTQGPDKAAVSAEPVVAEEATVAAAGAGGAKDAGSSAPAGKQGGGGADSTTADAISRGEKGRDEAVEGYGVAAEKLQQVPRRAHSLTARIAFSSPPPGTSAEVVRERLARNRVADFMGNALDSLEQATAYVGEEIPARLATAADDTKALIGEAMDIEKGLVSGRINVARGKAMGAAASVRRQILSIYTNSVKSVNMSTDVAIKALKDKHGTASRELARKETDALTEVMARFTRSRKQHESLGVTRGFEAIRTGQSHADAWEESCDTVNGKYYGDDGFWDGCLSMRRKRAQQDAACKTASGMYKNIARTANQKAFNLREQRTQYRCAVISGASKMQETMDKVVEKMTDGLEKGRTGVLGGLAQVRDMHMAAVDGALATTLESYDRQEREQRQAINDTGYIQQLAVEQLAHSTAADLARGTGAALESLEATLSQLRDQLAQGEVPEPEKLEQMLTTASSGLSQGMGALMENTENGVGAAEKQLFDAGTNTWNSLLAITTGNDEMTVRAEGSFATQMAGLQSGAVSVMSKLTQNHVTQAKQTTVQGIGAMDKMLSGFADSVTKIYSGVDEATKKSYDDLGKDLESMLLKLDGQIVSQAYQAAAKEQPAWKGVVAIVLIVLVIIASVVVSVLTLGAGAPFLAVVLVGAIVGGITAGLIQVINNWASGEAWDKDLIKSMVIGAVGGALGGAIGAGANGLAQAAVQGAIKAGASTATRVAINIGINFAGDMLSEGLSQGFAYVAYGQGFNWQGFVMAGAMSVASTARGGAAGGPSARGADVDVPAASPSAVRGAMTDLGVGLGVAGGMELLTVAAGGKFDANRFFSGAASGAVGSRAAARGGAPGKARSQTPDALPTTRLGKARARLGDIGSALGAKRDKAFSKMEISDSNRASKLVKRGMGATEDWFAAGAGRLVRKRDGVAPIAAIPKAAVPTTPELPKARAQTGAVDSTAKPRQPVAGDALPAGRRVDTDTTMPAPRRGGDAADSALPARSKLGEYDAVSKPNQPDADLVVPGASKHIKVGDGEHTVAAKRTESGDVVLTLCSHCSKISMSLDAAAHDGRITTKNKARIEELSLKVKELEAKIKSGEIKPEEVPGHVEKLAGELNKAASEMPGTVGKALGDVDFDPETFRIREEARAADPAGFAKVEEFLGKKVPPFPDALKDLGYLRDKNGIIKRTKKEGRVQLTDNKGQIEVVSGSVDRSPTLEAGVRRADIPAADLDTASRILNKTDSPPTPDELKTLAGLRKKHPEVNFDELAEISRIRNTPRDKRKEGDNQRLSKLREKYPALDLNDSSAGGPAAIKREGLGDTSDVSDERIRKLEEKPANERTADEGAELALLRGRKAASALEGRQDTTLSQGKRNQQTEALGELAADVFVDKQFPKAKKVFEGHGSGVLDRLYELPGPPRSFIVVEAKGGAATNSSTRLTDSGERMQQGRGDYLKDVLGTQTSIDKMSRGKQGVLSDSPDLRQDILDALTGGNVRYIEVTQKLTRDGQLGAIKAREYVL